jgi:thiopeptide-type bacteriocin biosynthesis protein
MSQPNSCQTADFFVLRSPGLPLEALFPRAQSQAEGACSASFGNDLGERGEPLHQTLCELIRRSEVREAVTLASPDLASRLDAWLDGSLEKPAARNVERALLKYLSRMSSRATPFGLFAGVSTGVWGPSNHLAVSPWGDARKALRLDWGVLETCVDRLEREPEVRAALRYQPNTSLYAHGGWYRYLERREGPGGNGRTYHLEAVEATPHLDHVLQQAREGARLDALTASLAERMRVELGEARAFLEQLIEAQLLCGDLQPPLTGSDPLGQVIEALQVHPETASRAELLVALALEFKTLQGTAIGSHPEGYRSLVGPLGELGVPADSRDVLQVDTFRPSPDLSLSPVVRRALADGAKTIRRLTPVPAPGPLERFRAAFLERYESRWMPLLEVLDEESGLGFDGGVPLDSPLLEGLPFPNPAPPRTLSQRDLFLLKQLPRWQGARIWELSDADLEALTSPEPQPFPQAFAAQASLAATSSEALERGEFQFWMEQYSGPTAARWLGRFASGNPDLKEALQKHLRKEEARRPEAVFAEVVHVPEGRMGNVLARPSLRDFEIPFLARSGVPADRTILSSDLQLTVRGDRILLASTRLGREVIPRLSSAHNFARGPAVYRFLAQLQDQDGRAGGWSWGALAEQPFLPRVVRGRHVLCKARWRIEARALKEAMTASQEGAWGAFQILRRDLGLPQFVVLTDADNTLLVDLAQGAWAETLHHLVAGRSSFILTECFPALEQALVTSPEGRFAHELIIPFEAVSSVPSKVGSLPPSPQAPKVRTFAPGSEWLYLKLYGGAVSVDRLLVELAPLLRETLAEGLWDRWHFVRYRDPEHHLRLRFHGLPARLLSELLPRLHGDLAKALAQGQLWKVQLDTFEPEWERYGGTQGFALAEAWFAEDSQHVLDLLVEGLTLEDRWKVGLRQVDAIWAALGLDLQARKALAQAARDGFRREFGDAGEGAVEMGVRFRGLRKELESGFPRRWDSPLTSGLGGLPRIREAFDQGLLLGELSSLAGSLTHMHLNRLLRSHPREHEWVLMEFLVRLYDSCLARHSTDPVASGLPE